ncbi:MAG: ATP-binding protein, partial [Sedimentisphaerales bacterium]
DLLHFEGPLGAPVFRALQTRTGLPGRAVSLRFRPNSGSHDSKSRTLALVVARDATELQDQLHSLCWLLLTASAGTIILSFLVAAVVVRQGLNPLNSIASEIAAIKEDDLTTRIEIASVPAEVLPIKNRLNELLSRLEEAFKRERRITSDVAHELRTPLAGMQSTLEVALSRTRDVNEYQASLSDCLTISRNMQRMVDNLLTLARLDAHQITFRRVRIQPAELVSSCWRSFSDRARQREIVFDNHIPAELTCESDPENLSTALSNLLDNAVEYTNKAGQIWTTARQVAGSIEIAVANTGCKLTNGQASQVFDCFWRGDSSRKDAGVHCGLGLALVQRIVRALGGSTSADVQADGIFTVRLILPVIQQSHRIQ